MSAAFAFADRCRREIMRDPLPIIFGIGLPLTLLILLSLIGRNVPQDIFPIAQFAPGMAVFSLTFLMLFGGQLLAADRSSAYLARIFVSPLRARDYLLAYTFPLIPLGLLQGAVCFSAALFFGLELSFHLLWAELALIPVILFYISLGLLFGVLFTDKQTGPISSIVIQAASLLSGIWFDPDMIGGLFSKITKFLPFLHGVQCVQQALAGDLAAVLPHAAVIFSWTAVLFIITALLFRRRIRQG